ncbi:MAG TPA: GNAT family N-acetyltransferase [Tepidisphaeraceae bacterium]|nr:GNAT family N-acetyltransferase [Tepidisphaeraceae bacterium]
MTLHELRDQPSAARTRALASFEEKFTYPLGPGRWFRISHGDDYPRFFRSMGEATCLIVEDEGRVLGAVGIAIRPLILSDGQMCPTAYIGDLKVDPDLHGSRVFLTLARAALNWARPRVGTAVGVVMDGTRALPSLYTGRVGIPSFQEVGKLLIFRLPITRPQNPNIPKSDDEWSALADRGEERHRVLSRGRCYFAGGTPADRSAIAPQWLIHPQGLACGRLEDTRLAKRLIDNAGNEMLNAHLACFAWNDPTAASELLQATRRRAAALGFDGLFTTISPGEMPALRGALNLSELIVAPASVFGAGLESGLAWNINSSEI